MTRLICVICRARSENTTVFKFPSDKVFQQRWKTLVGVSEIATTSGVCLKHFRADGISVTKKRARLLKGVLPSLQLEHRSDTEQVCDAEVADVRQPSTGSTPVSVAGSADIDISQPCTSTPVAVSREQDAAGNEGALPKGKTRHRRAVGMRSAVMVRRLTLQRLKTIQGQLMCDSVSQTISLLAKRYLWVMRRKPTTEKQASQEIAPVRPLSADNVDQQQFFTPSSVATVEPPGNTAPYTPHTECSFTPGSAAPTPRRDLAEAELLESLDIDLEAADDAEGDELEATDASGMVEDSVLGEDDSVDAAPHWDVRSAVVAEPQLLQLLTELPAICQQCSCEVPPHVRRQSLSYHVTWTCDECQGTVRKPWHSTEKEGQVAVFDTVFAAAITLSGCSVAGVVKLMTFSNMGRLSASAHHRIANRIVNPVIDEAYKATIAENRAAAQSQSPEGLVVAGDCQNDSPGYSASYGTYTLMDNTTGHIVAQHTVSRQEVCFSSPREEVEGASRCLHEMMQANVPIVEYVSDQHVGVKKLVENTLPGVKYSFDVWHAAKNVGKRLNAFAVKAKYKKLRPWVSHLKNHFWYCAKTSEGDDTIFRKRWVMAVHHVCGEHVTKSGTNACHHDVLDEHELEWLTPGSDAHKAVQDVVLSPRTLGLSRHVSSFRHTGRLEVFHSTSNAYAPKQKFYSYTSFIARKQVAVLDYTAHLQRPVARNRDGTVRMKRAYSRVSDKYVLRPIKVTKTFTHIRPLLKKMVELRRHTSIIGQKERRVEDPRKIHPYVHRGPRENESTESLKEEAGQHSRF